MNYFSYSPLFKDLIERSIDQDTGEIINPDFEEELRLLEMAQNEKIEQAALAYKNAKAEYEVVDKIYESFRSKRENLSKLMESLKSYCTCELGGKKYKTPLLSIYYGSRSHVEITDESQIPDDFWKVERTVKKKEILNAINMGENVPGAFVQPVLYTVIR